MVNFATTLAVHLALAAEEGGLATVIFELDPRANATVWGDARASKIPAVVPAQAPLVRPLATGAAERSRSCDHRHAGECRRCSRQGDRSRRRDPDPPPTVWSRPDFYRDLGEAGEGVAK